MTPELRHIGHAEMPVVILDGISGVSDEIVEIAAALAPYGRRHGSYYPELRRVIEAKGLSHQRIGS